MSAYFDCPAGRHDAAGRHRQRPARLTVEHREIDAAALLKGARFVGLPAQDERVRDLASRVDQARERKPVAPLGLQAVVRRALRDGRPGRRRRVSGVDGFPALATAEPGLLMTHCGVFRRRFPLLERTLNRAGRADRLWNIWSPYEPVVVQRLVNAFRSSITSRKQGRTVSGCRFWTIGRGFGTLEAKISHIVGDTECLPRFDSPSRKSS
jgi:hypothetical protein